MWWRAVLVFSLAILDNISAQDDNNATETQTKMCCPCPPGVIGIPMDAAASTLAPGAVAVARGVDGVDDCPCRARDADSEGAASLFFPHAVRAFGNVMRSNPKEESKPLLHPEVGLASSVLETLREATDEEYRDALERDAARATVDVASLTDLIDGAPEEARNVVTVIVSPRGMDDSDAIPEASHVQETRCIHSLLGNPGNSLSYRTPSKGLEDILNLPLPSGMLHRQRDSGLAASNVHESVVKADDNLNTLLPELKFKAKPNLLSLDPKTINENINNIISGANLGIKPGSISLNRNEMDNSNARTDSVNDQISSEVVGENNDILTENNFNRQSDGQNDLDCNTSPSINQETIAEKSAKNTGPLQSLLFGRDNNEKPGLSFPLKNLLKLRDVELVPLDVLNNKPKTKNTIPSLKLHPLQKTEAREPVNLPKKPSKIANVLNKLNKAKTANIQVIPKRKPVTTDILDAVPSPSDDNCVRLKPGTDNSVGVDMEQLEDSLLDSSTETDDTGNEQANDLIAKSTDILNSNSAEDVQIKSSEIFQDEEVDDSEDFQIIDDTQTPVQESESYIQIISQEDISDIPPGSVDLSEINEAEDRSNSEPVALHPLKTLEGIRRNVVDKLEALQKSNINALDSIKHNVEEISPQGDSMEARNQDTRSEENIDQISSVGSTLISPTSFNPIEEGLQDKSASVEAVSFQDLQNISDSILMASENHEQRAQEQNEEFLESKEVDTISEEANESDIDNILGMDGKETENDLNQNIDDSNRTDKTLCPSDLLKTSKQAKVEDSNSVNNVNTENDLETLASDPIMDILRPIPLTSGPIINILRPNSKSLVEHLNNFRTKLRQSIVQPAPLINDLNIFSTPSFNLPDLSGLNTNIPTLDDIRTRVSEILDGLARTANDDDGSSELEDFASDVNPVQSASPSSSDPVSIFSPLKPLEDINLDIIQLKPLPSLLGSSPHTPDLPGLNLNRYKAKLAVPKSLDLKPLNLASTLGNNGGLVGTTLTIGPQKKAKTGTPKVKSNKSAQFVSSRGALNSNPTLADITSTMHKNALNLLNIPKSPTLQASNTVGNLAERIKSHAEDTVKSIHETLNPSALAEVHNNVLKNANNLLTAGGNNLQNTLQSPSQIDSVVDNLRSQTQNTIQHLHNTLKSPRVASDVLKNSNSILKSPKSSLDAAVDNTCTTLNTFNNIKQTLDTSRLADLSDSIHKGTKNILKYSAAITPAGNLLGSTMQAVPTIDEVAGNLRSHTQSTLRNIQQTLNTPTLSDISTSIKKSAQKVLNSPITNSSPQILKNTLQPSTSLDTVVDNLRSQTQNTMKNIQNSLNAPTLSDISATVQKHAQNMLNSPVASTGRDAFKQVLQASSPINLIPHADQVAKDFQKTLLKAALLNSPINDLPPLPHPNDVIQSLTDRHADINDKLYALHTDLNDRLESIHNEIKDPARLRSILSPPGNRNFELFAIPLPMSYRSMSVPKKAIPILQAKQPVLASQRKQPKIASTVTKPRTRIEIAKPNSMRGSKGRENSPTKSFRMSSAASSPTPTRIERPTLSLTSKKPIKGLQDLKKPLLPKLKPLTKSKVTITFGSTTQRPSPVGKSKGFPTTAKPKVSANNRFKPSLVRQPTPWHGKGEARTAPKRLGEPLTSPSKTAPTLRPLSKGKSAEPISKPIKTGTSRLSPVSKLKSQTTPKPILKTTPRTLGRASAPSRPKSPLLTKLTDALKSKGKPLDKLSQTPRARTEEMAPSASKRFEKVVALEEPMKENVSYKCKMMCVKVDLNEE
ncbi:uncharacterized protein LOC134750288 [Cydia strobilella]|uniref:uncharacterized protein LOC134750288 n=1 Tax=Cydia strobilella TaxID=1100964 RepID=UPI003004A3AA